MTALARTETLAQRTAILSRLTLRNRLVGILRWGVPAIGLVVFVALALQLYVGNLLQQFGIAGITIDRNNLVVETPSYVAAGADGTLYRMAAEEARAAFDKPELMLLTNATLDVGQTGVPGYHATAAAATLATTSQELRIPGTAYLTSDDGMTGTLQNVTADLERRSMIGEGPVAIVFADGSTLDASAMRYEPKGRLWHFDAVTITLPDTPKVIAP